MEKIDNYKVQLLNAGFSEAKMKPYRFYRANTENTAFIINLNETDNGVGVLYGFCSTSRDTEYKDYFEKWCRYRNDCNLRYYTEIESDENDYEADKLIREFYIMFRNTNKEDLLNIVKERRKVFLQRFTDLLKPLGFRKKSNKWSKKFADEYILTFYAQKSDYSDQYYFNLSIDKEGIGPYVGCYHTRIKSNSEYIFNWQLMSSRDIEALINAIKQEVNTILNTQIEILGKQKWVWDHCICQRDKCNVCWVEKNRFEANESVDE